MVKIIDFGSAGFVNQEPHNYIQTRPYRYLLIFQYLIIRAPEIIFGCEFDFAIDIWSFGCILYEIIASDVLFKSSKVLLNICKAASINGTINFSMFKNGTEYDKLVLNDKYLYNVIT